MVTLSNSSKFRPCRHGGALALSLCLSSIIAVEPPVTPTLSALGLAAAAHGRRVDLAREAATWASERQRLDALIAATIAETQRLQRDIEVGERAKAEAEARLAALGSGSDLDVLRLRLAEAGGQLARGLAELTTRTPPGAVVPPAKNGGETGFDAAVRALEAAERAAGTITIDVVTGRRDGRPEAVKLLRVGGAAAWWSALDGLSTGTIRQDAEGILLIATGDQAVHAQIVTAFGHVEGRVTPAVALLPGDAP